MFFRNSHCELASEQCSLMLENICHLLEKVPLVAERKAQKTALISDNSSTLGFNPFSGIFMYSLSIRLSLIVEKIVLNGLNIDFEITCYVCLCVIPEL